MDGDASDKDKIVSEDSDAVAHKNKKRKKVRKTKSVPLTEEHDGDAVYLRQVSSYSCDGQPTHRVDQVPLENVGSSREKLLNIHEELNNTHLPHSKANCDETDLRKLALHLAINKSSEGKTNKFLHYDYVLVHKTGDNRNAHEKLRKKYEAELHTQGFRVDRKYTAEKTFVILHCSFERLCEEAEKVSLEMPLAGVS